MYVVSLASVSNGHKACETNKQGNTHIINRLIRRQTNKETHTHTNTTTNKQGNTHILIRLRRQTNKETHTHINIRLRRQTTLHEALVERREPLLLVLATWYLDPFIIYTVDCYS